MCGYKQASNIIVIKNKNKKLEYIILLIYLFIHLNHKINYIFMS